MSIYGAFNKVKTLEQLKSFVENNDFDSLNETCEEIKKEYKIEESNTERYMYGVLNQSGRTLAEKFMLRGIISKPNFYQLKSIEVERSDVFQVAELFIYDYITIKDSDAEEYVLLFSLDYMTKIRNSYKQSKSAKERNITNVDEVAIILLGKYIANNINNLDFRIEAKLESTYILSEIKMLNRTIEEKIESAKIRIDEIEPKIDEMGPTLQITKGKVEHINNNMITIMALFLSAFSIIGINIYSLQASISAREVILVNSSLVFVLAFLMNLLDLILNKEMYIYPEEKYIENIKKHRNRMRGLMALSALILGSVLLWTYLNPVTKMVRDSAFKQSSSSENQILENSQEP